jgi:PKD repeat protein
MRLTIAGRVALATLVAASATLFVATAGVGAVAVTCSKWAATSGDDANAGSQAAPYRSLGMLAASLAAGQTGCLPAGQTYFAVAGNGIVGAAPGTAAAPITITSDPSGRATVEGQLWLKPESHDVILTGLDFRGGYTETGAPLYTKGAHLIVQGDRIAITANDIADPRGICIVAGRADATDPAVNDVAEDLRITGNRIHDCGMDPSIVWTDQDSGSHGVYLENTLHAVIAENLIYRNRWRGLQLWPRNDGATIAHNVFDENATHVNIGSSLGPPYNGGFVAQNTTVSQNIFTGRVTDFHPGQNPSQIYGYFPDGSPTYGNTVSGNCFAPGDPAATGSGFALGANTTAQALFTDRAARDYRLLASSPCQGDGPASIQPPVDELPTAAYTPSTYTPVQGQAVAFNGAASNDPDGTITTYRWVWGDGTPDGSGATPTHVFAAQGRVSVGLYVTDTDGRTAAVGHGITVGDEPPSAAYTPSTYTPAAGQTVSFDGSRSADSDGTITTYRWVWGDGTPDGSGPTPTHVFTTEGRLSVGLYVTDSDGRTAAVGHGITVSDELPSAVYTPSTYVPAQGQTVSFNGSASSDPDGVIATYRWVWGDGTPDGSGPSPTHVFTTQGRFSVALYVTDWDGLIGAVGHGITVGDELPSAVYTPSTYTPAAGQTVSFNAGASRDPDGTIVAYRWVWGDGTPDGGGATPTHVFTAPGKFSVGLYVTDSDGRLAAVGHGFTVGTG